MIIQTVKDLYQFKAEQISNKVAAGIGISSFFAYSLFWLAYMPLSETAETLFFLISMAVLSRRPFSRLFKGPLGIFLLIWLGLLVVNGVVNHEYYSGHMSYQLNSARHFTKIFLAFLLAWWMSGSSRVVFVILFFACLGFLFGPLITGYNYSNEIKLFHDGRRITLGYKNWEHVSVYASFTLFVLAVFYKRIMALFTRKWIGAIFITLGISYSSAVIYAANTRATYIGLAVALITACVYLLSKLPTLRNSITRRQLRTGLAITFISIFVLTGSGFNPFAKVLKRFKSENDVIENIVSGDFNHVRMSSIGIRIYLWRYALHKIMEHPLVGYGPRTHELILTKNKDVSMAVKNAHIGHFHNSFIELLFAFGIAGLLLFGTIVIYIAYGVRQARLKGLIPNDIFIFLLTFSSYWLTVNLFESYIIYTSGIYINALFGAAALTFHLNSSTGHNSETALTFD